MNSDRSKSQMSVVRVFTVFLHLNYFNVRVFTVFLHLNYFNVRVLTVFLHLNYFNVTSSSLDSGGPGEAQVFDGVQSCKISQIWQIYLCKNIKNVG